MMRFATVAVVLTTLAGSGCTTLALERYTLSQIESTQNYRYNATLECLATVAANPGTLPSFSILSDGTVHIQDMETLSASTSWTRAIGGFASQTFGLTLSRSPQEYWTIAPVADYTQLEALRCACQWAIRGCPPENSPCVSLLASPVDDPFPGPHFGVAGRLSRLPPGWLHCGRSCDVPTCACYKANCGPTWVWVNPDGLRGLSEFTLILLDIATIDVSVGATTSPPLLVTLTTTETFQPYTWSDLEAVLNKLTSPQDKQTLKSIIDQRAILTVDDWKAKFSKAGMSEIQKVLNTKATYAPSLTETRVVKPECRAIIEDKIRNAAMTNTNQGTVELTWADWMAYTVPYHFTRTNVKPQGGMGSPSPTPQAVPQTLARPLLQIGPTLNQFDTIPPPTFQQQLTPELRGTASPAVPR